MFLALYAALALLVRGASRTLTKQTVALEARSRELLDSYRRVEESSLEAIESLNATVEAKDPYTAGHSQRVQNVAVALGERLDLPEDRMDALRLGSTRFQSSATTMSAGTGMGTPTAWQATRSRSRPRSSASPMRGTQ